MKKLLIIGVILFLAGSALAQFDAGKDNPQRAFPGVLNSYSKDYVLRIPINYVGPDTSAQNADTLAANFVGRKRVFMLPEAAELMGAWLTASDSTLDSFRLRFGIYSNAGGAADTACYYGTGAKGIKPYLGYAVPVAFTFTTSIAKRQFSKGEAGVIRVDTTASTAVLPTQIPAGMEVYMLFRPKSYPVPSDQYYR